RHSDLLRRRCRALVEGRLNVVDDASERDLAALQGTWRQVAFEENGLVDAPDDVGGNGTLTLIEGSHFRVRSVAGDVLLQGAFELDASVRPGSITWIDATGPDAGDRLPAIYRLDDDRFEFIAAD